MPEVEIDADFTQTHRIVKYRYIVSNLELHSSVTLVIILVDELQNEVHRVYKKIEGTEYDAWGTDDSYLDEIADKEVKKIVSLVEPEVVAEPEL